MVKKIYQEILAEENVPNTATAKKGNSFTLQKFYEQNRGRSQRKKLDQETAETLQRQQKDPSGSEDFELTAGSRMLKREPVPVSSEELDTDFEQTKELLRTELSQGQDGEPTDATEDNSKKQTRKENSTEEEDPSKR